MPEQNATRGLAHLSPRAIAEPKRMNFQRKLRGGASVTQLKPFGRSDANDHIDYENLRIFPSDGTQSPMPEVTPNRSANESAYETKFDDRRNHCRPDRRVCWDLLYPTQRRRT